MDDPWGQRPPLTLTPKPAAGLPPDVKRVVDEFLNAPETRADIKRAAATVVAAVERAKAVGVYVALAEIDDRDMRLAFAKTLTEMNRVGRKAVSG